jgi:hypothetical protein
MNSLIVEVGSDKYLIRYQVLKSVVSRKHTYYEYKKVLNEYTEEIELIQYPVVTNRLEKHPNSCEVYLYSINNLPLLDVEVNDFSNPKKIKLRTKLGYLTCLGKGLSKCSDKDKFDKNLGIRVAISNIESLTPLEHNSITKAISTMKL